MKRLSDKILFVIKTSYFFVLILLVSIAITSCSFKNTEANDTETIETDDTVVGPASSITDKTDYEIPVIESTALESVSDCTDERLKDYSIKADSGFIALLDWDNVIDFNLLLGEPLNEDVQVLGKGSDTFSGSFLKTMKYEGLEIILFSPKDNGSSFWVMEIIVSGEEYSTYQGIKFGDTLKTLKEKYPAIYKRVDGRQDDNNCAYEIADLENYNYLRFEVSDGMISQIRLFHEIP